MGQSQSIKQKDEIGVKEDSETSSSDEDDDDDEIEQEEIIDLTDDDEEMYIDFIIKLLEKYKRLKARDKTVNGNENPDR